MTNTECKYWFDYHAAAFPSFSRTYASLRQASSDQARHGWNFIQSDLADVTLQEAKEATDEMRGRDSQLKPERHSREVARIALGRRAERRLAKESWDCQLCRDTGTAQIFSGCCQYAMHKIHETYWKNRVTDEGVYIMPDPRWKYFTWTMPCCCVASNRVNMWLDRHKEHVVPAWRGVYVLTDEDKLKIETGAEQLLNAQSWQTPRIEMEF